MEFFFWCLTSTSNNCSHAKEISTKLGGFLELKHSMVWMFMFPPLPWIYVEILVANVMVLGVGPLGDDYCMLSHSVVSDSLQPYGLQPTRLLCPWRFSRQEYWSGLTCPLPGDLPNPGIEPMSPALQVDSLMTEPSGKPREMIRSKEWSPHGWN